MRAVLLTSSLVLASCTCAEPMAQPRDGGADVGPVDPPPVESEGHLFLATLPSGALHVVRVETDGTAAPWGPPVTARVGRLVQSDDARRVILQDYDTNTAQALHGDRWASICGGLGAERCSASDYRPDLGVLLLARPYDDTSGERAALLSYAGQRLAPSDGSIVVFSDLGWSVLTDIPRTLVHTQDGRTHELAMLEREFPERAVGTQLLTASNDYMHVWLRDPESGSRAELTCPDGHPATDLWRDNTELVCCGEQAYRLRETGLSPTTHRCDAAQRFVHLEDGAYTVTELTRGRSTALSFRAPDGGVIAALTRDYPPPTSPVESAAHLLVLASRASPARFIAYVVLQHLGFIDDPYDLVHEEGVVVFDLRAGSIDWHPIDLADAPSYRVWLPSTAERALWLTPDGRLVSFELDTRALVDRTGALQFHPNLDGS
ncbi:MAG: hypothetical protein K1X94_23735 [Sandaracinaceae bacterium]|nr:hypothetical protein [Sandaracinaceae bacterium]